MSRNKIISPVSGKEVSSVVEAGPGKSPGTRATSKEQFDALIDAYKKQNPVKFAAKKSALEAKLASL